MRANSKPGIGRKTEYQSGLKEVENQPKKVYKKTLDELQKIAMKF